VRGTFRQFDHTGDVGIDAEAPDEAALYACCAAALFDVLVESGSIVERETKRISISAPDRELLLVRWLGEILYLHSTGGWLFRDFDVRTEEGEKGFTIEAIARGEILDPSRHTLRTEIKAVTHHQAAVSRDAEGTWRARIVFDI
jgi:SHS2 domain-containing protein